MANQVPNYSSFNPNTDHDIGYESQSSEDFSHSRKYFADHFGMVIPKHSNEADIHNTNDLTNSSNVIHGEPLPNASRSKISFKLLKYPQQFSNSNVKDFYKNNAELLNHTLLKPKLTWTREDDKLLWNSIFGAAISFPFPYFSFFMDRSLNVILKVCNKSLISGSNVTCFTQEIFDILVKKSFTYYGRLVKDIRESIAQYVENSTIISWLAYWSLFIHTNSTVKVSNLILTGSASLLWNSLNEYNSLPEVHPTLAFITRAIKTEVLSTVIPDYNFDVVRQLYQDFINFKKFILYNQELTTKNNGYILKSFVDLENFLKHLIEERYPQMVKINEEYKKKYNVSSDNIHFISPEDTFAMIVDWFNVIPSHALSVGKSMTPLKRTFYLFFAALGMSLAGVFPMLRSVFLVDPWNMVYPTTDFDTAAFEFSPNDVSSIEQFQYLSHLSKKLLRMINFFKNRRLLLLYYLKSQKFTEPHIEQVSSNGSSKGIIYIKPEKIQFEEVMVTDFGVNNIINIYNYPAITKFYQQPEFDAKVFKRTIDKENHDQKVRIQKFRSKYEIKNGKTNSLEYMNNNSQLHDFDYERGMFSYDYNIDPAIKALGEVHDRENTTIQSITSIKQEVSNFEHSQKEIANCLH
ncbi:hypothetical protein SBY92_000887 [Candida maltosa Xu316]